MDENKQAVKGGMAAIIERESLALFNHFRGRNVSPAYLGLVLATCFKTWLTATSNEGKSGRRIAAGVAHIMQMQMDDFLGDKGNG